MSDKDRFSHHEPCPSCGSRDNVAVWGDGHKYCFGCGWKDSGTKSIASMQEKLYKDNSITNANIPNIDSISSHIPPTPLKWLLKYGILPAEIKHFKIGWSELRSSLVFPIHRGSTLIATNERYFGEDKAHPKYKTYGPKTGTTVLIKSKHTELPDLVILVEDFVSAIKVGRQFHTVPLFGASVPANGLKWASDEFKRMGVWLDMDKAVKSLQEASKASQYLPTRSIFSPYDPKEYSNDDIYRKVMEVFGESYDRLKSS